jgi:hypothetical protein
VKFTGNGVRSSLNCSNVIVINVTALTCVLPALTETITAQFSVQLIFNVTYNSTIIRSYFTVFDYSNAPRIRTAWYCKDAMQARC